MAKKIKLMIPKGPRMRAGITKNPKRRYGCGGKLKDSK
jgi:hypothetical protein